MTLAIYRPASRGAPAVSHDTLALTRADIVMTKTTLGAAAIT
jgi:hypothetical protein